MRSTLGGYESASRCRFAEHRWIRRRLTRLAAIAFALAPLAFSAASAQAAPGDISTVAGTGSTCTTRTLRRRRPGHLGPALHPPMLSTADGGFLIADYSNYRIRKVSAACCTITDLSPMPRASSLTARCGRRRGGDLSPAQEPPGRRPDPGRRLSDRRLRQQDPQGLGDGDDRNRCGHRHQQLLRRRRPGDLGRAQPVRSASLRPPTAAF